MTLDTKIRAKMADALAKSYYIPWYKRWWGRTLIVLILLVLIIVGYFAQMVYSNVQHRVKGDIYNKETGQWITLAEYKETRRAISKLITGDDPWLGAEEPAVYIEAYESFGCPFCKANQKDLKELLAHYSSVVRLVVKDFPLEGIQPGVFDAHLAAACADEQGKYWEYHDYIYEHQDAFTKAELKQWAKTLSLDTAKFNKCLDDEKYSNEIRQDYAEGVEAGVVGTPGYVINGTLISGTIPFETWQQILAYIIKNN